MDLTTALLFALCCTIFTQSLAAPLDNDDYNRLRIVNGTDAKIDHIPFQVSLQFYGSHTCGGAILTADTIITAAHCLDIYSEYHSISTLSVRVGSSYRERDGQVFNLTSVIIHEKYNSTNYDYDIALLKLAQPMTFSMAVQPLALAQNRANLADNEMVQVSGWGRVRTGGPLAEVLQRIDMPVISQTECTAMFRLVNTITDRMICAGYVAGTGDSCNGDSGGPMVNRNNVLYGLVSWGPAQCASVGYTGVYTNVAFFYDWIVNHY